MITENDNHIEEWLSKWNRKHTPAIYHFYRDEDGFGYVFGKCYGIVIYPRNDGHLLMADLIKDDELYFLSKSSYVMHTSWIEDKIKCFQVAEDYLAMYATPFYYEGLSLPHLPWKEDTDRNWIKEDNYWVRKTAYNFNKFNYNKKLMIEFIDELRYLVQSETCALVYIEDDEISIVIRDKELKLWDIKSNGFVPIKQSTYCFNPYNTQSNDKDNEIYKLLAKYHNRWPNKSKMEVNFISI